MAPESRIRARGHRRYPSPNHPQPPHLLLFTSLSSLVEYTTGKGRRKHRAQLRASGPLMDGQTGSGWAGLHSPNGRLAGYGTKRQPGPCDELPTLCANTLQRHAAFLPTCSDHSASRHPVTPPRRDRSDPRFSLHVAHMRTATRASASSSSRS
ncbi:hypothetical protein VDGL01_10563 [Verticillium dahliae]